MIKPFTRILEKFQCLLLYAPDKPLHKRSALLLLFGLLLIELLNSLSASAQINNGYCQPQLGSCCEWISEVRFNTINKSTGNEPGYADYTGISTTVNRGQTIPISVTVSTDDTYQEYVTLYFDWDRNYTFETEVKLGGKSINGQATFNGSVTVPAGAPDGCSLMRVFMKYASAPNGACSTGDGEVEDYTILVNKPSPTPVAAFTPPTGIICTQSPVQFTNNSTIADNTALSYSWDFGDGTTSTAANPSKTFTTAGTYTVKLTAKTFCASQITTHTITVNPKPLAPVITGITDDNGDSNTDNITEDNTLILKGTAAANTQITLSKTGTGQIGTVTTNTNGNWSFDYSQTSLALGPHTFTATAANSNGCVSGVSNTLTVTIEAPKDNVPPATPAIPILTANINGNTNNNKPTITGTAEVNADVAVYINGVKTGTVKADNNGTWQYTFATALAEGSHTVYVTATDAAGNISEQSPGLTFKVDTLAPAKPATPVLTAGINGATNNNTPEITGTTEPYASVKIYSGSNYIGSVVADVQGNWRYTFEVALPDGFANIKVNATDATANTSAFSDVLTINIDTQAPVVPANLSLAPGNDSGISQTDNITNIAQLAVVGSAEPGATVTVYAGTTKIGTALADNNGNWQVTLAAALPDGQHTFTVTATDAVGNNSAVSTPLTITVKTTLPTAPANLSLAPNNDSGVNQQDRITNVAKPVITGTAEPGVLVKLFVGTEEVGAVTANETGSWQITTEKTLADGNYQFTASATDLADNKSIASSPLMVTIDKTAPVGHLAIINNAGFTNNTEVNLAITAGDATEIRFSNDNATWTAWEPAVATQNWTLTQTDGLKTVYLTLHDAAGNIAAPVTATITLDQTAPVVTGVMANGIYNTNRQITFNEGSATLNNTTFANNTTVSATGMYNLVVTDAAGNTTSINFEIDKINPVVTGVTNNGIYNTDLTIGFNEGTATLNNNAFANGASITAEGQHTVVVTDAAGNATTIAFTIDKTAPSGTLAINSNASVTNATTVSLGLTTTDGTGTGHVQMRLSNDENNWSTWEIATANKNWTLPAGDGEKFVFLQLQDKAGNISASIRAAITLDQTKPTVTLATTAPNPTNAAFQVRFTFSEAVADFAGGKILVNNGTITDFAAESQTSYTATITPVTNGEVSVTVLADKTQDAATNGNIAAIPLTRIFDNIAPSGYTAQFYQNRIDVSNVTKASVTIASAEIGTSYFYSISSENGGTPVTGTETVSTGQFTINLADLSSLTDGKLTFALYLEDAAGNKGDEVTTQVMKYTKDVVTVTRPVVYKAPIRTAFEQLGLPGKVEVTYSSGTKEEIAVTWLPGNYNGLIAGPYELTGNLMLAPGTTNLENIQAIITVEVQPNKVPTGLTLSATTFSPNIAATDAVGTFSTSDADDTEHVYALVSGQGDTHNSLFQIINNQLYLKSTSGLSGQTQFSIRVITTDPYHNTFEREFKLTKSAYAKAPAELKIVNAFTPNGDGVNDEWSVPELKFYNQVSIEVFDQSGVRLFQTTNPERGWDGRNKYGQVLQGAFLYVIQVEDIKLTKKGVVTVLKK